MSDVFGKLLIDGEIRQASEEERERMTTIYYRPYDAFLVLVSGDIILVCVFCSLNPFTRLYSFWESGTVDEVFVGLGPDPLSDPWYAIPEGVKDFENGAYHTTVGSIFLIK